MTARVINDNGWLYLLMTLIQTGRTTFHIYIKTLRIGISEALNCVLSPGNRTGFINF